MSAKILLIFDDTEQADLVEDLLIDTIGKDVSVKVTPSEAKAREKLTGRKYDLLITNLHKTPLQTEENRGLVFVQSLQGEGKKIPSILLLSRADERVIKAIDDLFQCQFVFENSREWQEDLIEKSKKILGLGRFDGEEKGKAKRLDVDITLDLNRNTGECSFQGVNFECGLDRATFAIDGGRIGKLAKRSRHIEGHPAWQDELQDIGEELMTQIFQNNPKVGPFFFQQAGKLGGLQNVRIRFMVEKTVHPIALEALFGLCDVCDDYWMLHAPIYRTAKEFPGLRAPLFQDEETRERPMNCLIIEASTTGSVRINHEKVNLEALGNLEGECNFLEDNLKKYQTGNQGKLRVGRIERINKQKVEESNKERGENKSFAETLRDLLRSDTWHLVHYAGHSYYDSDHDRGFVFFPEKFPKEMDIEEFSKWLRDAKNRFVYLSSCRSSEEDFVFALASQDIPAIVGFRWDIEDKLAEEYTTFFYDHLLGGNKSLEYAFLESRKRMHEAHKKNKIWAAPMLVMQLKASG